jgi:hypothetical protein
MDSDAKPDRALVRFGVSGSYQALTLVPLISDGFSDGEEPCRNTYSVFFFTLAA